MARRQWCVFWTAGRSLSQDGDRARAQKGVTANTVRQAYVDSGQQAIDLAKRVVEAQGYWDRRSWAVWQGSPNPKDWIFLPDQEGYASNRLPDAASYFQAHELELRELSPGES